MLSLVSWSAIAQGIISNGSFETVAYDPIGCLMLWLAKLRASGRTTAPRLFSNKNDQSKLLTT